MGRKQCVGRALMNTRNKKKSADFKHPSELQKISVNQGSSITEESSVSQFFSLAQLANADYTAQRHLPQVVNIHEGSRGILSSAEEHHLQQLHDDNKSLLRIPRRPKWDSSTSKEELIKLEEADFLEWRRRLAELEKNEQLVLTPFEKNLEFWRQLWRVIERADCVVQILDSRNPLLFRCEDLEKYVREVNPDKTCCLLANKADLLTEKQRELWAKYFSQKGIRIIFWSAKLEAAKCAEETSDKQNTTEAGEETKEEATEQGDAEEDKIINEFANMSTSVTGEKDRGAAASVQIENSPCLVTSQELLSKLWQFHNLESGVISSSVFTVGLVGYPNVGKSSTLNAILNVKKVPVSATPGRTKHFQTFNVPFESPEDGTEKSIQLCDCPGLVMPSFAFTKAHLLVSGILPVDNMRDYFSPISVICSQFPREILMSIYGINIPAPPLGDSSDRNPTARELLEAYSYMHGYMSSQGLPNCDRAARIILKDYINGRLLYCHPPPEVTESEFCPLSGNERIHARKLQIGKEKIEAAQTSSGDCQEPQLSQLERRLLTSSLNMSAGGFMGKARPESFSHHSSSRMRALDGKQSKRHGNAKRREKLRRVYAHLDDN